MKPHKSSKPARIVLAIVIASMWKHLLLSIKDQLLFYQTLELINLLYENKGFVFLMMNCNLRANQEFLQTYQKKY